MATIDMSPAFINAFNNRVFGITSNSTTLNGSTNSFISAGYSSPGYGCSVMAIMQGSVPSNFSTLTSFSARSSDALVIFVPGAGTIGDFSPSNTSANPALISTVYKTATQAGTATWLWWLVVSGQTASPFYTTSTAPIHQMIGTIGTSGSGADFIMSSTTISTSFQYRVVNLQLSIPTPWTYTY